MTNEPNYINPLSEVEPAAEVLSEEQLAINFLESLRIHAADHFDKPNFALYKNGIGFAPLGNIMAICAEAKNGKSWLMQQFVIAMLKGEFCGLTSELENPKVLYFDTEQDKYDAKMIQTRVHYAVGWPFEEDNERFQLYSMDDFDCIKKDLSIQANRLFAIETAIEYYKPNVVFIDGVRDLVFDFNDLPESAVLVQKLMSMARRNSLLICTVLHVNPNSDKMRGHLGTEMQNKTTDVFTVKKEGDSLEKSFHVKQIAARHQDVEDWIFRISDNGRIHLPVLLGQSDEDAEPEQPQKDDKVLKAMLSIQWTREGLRYTDVEAGLKSYGITSKRKLSDYIVKAVEDGILTKDEDTKRYYMTRNDAVIDQQTSLLEEDNDEMPF